MFVIALAFILIRQPSEDVELRVVVHLNPSTSRGAEGVDRGLRSALRVRLAEMKVTEDCHAGEVFNDARVRDGIEARIVRSADAHSEIATLRVDAELRATLRAACENSERVPRESLPVFVGHGRAADVECPRARDEDRVTMIGLARTACFGTCPVYSVVLRADGTVEYEGKKFVPFIGRRVGKLEPVLFEQLAELVNASGFFCMAGHYARGITDHPTAYVTVRRGRVRKQVQDYASSAPEKLGDLQVRIDQTLTTVHWDDVK